jgi:hypothetical protein
MNLSEVPTQDLIAELQRRMGMALARVSELLGVMNRGEPPRELEADEPEAAVEAVPPEDAPAPEPWNTNYTNAKAAGLAVPNRDPNRELPAHLKKVRELPKLMDPERKAAMWEAVDRDLEAGLPGALADAEARGDTDAADYLRQLPSLRARSAQAPPGLAQIIAINKRNSQDAMRVEILPPSLKGAVQAPVLTNVQWYDNPSVASIPLLPIVTNPAPPRIGVPGTPPYELDARVKGLAKLLKGLFERMMTDGFTGHLPRPVVKVCEVDGIQVLQLLLEPVVIWRLLLYLGPHLPYVHYASNLARELNLWIEAKVAKEERVLVGAGADPERFRDAMTTRLNRWHGEALDLGQNRIAQGLRRQIKILNVDFQERNIPAPPPLTEPGDPLPGQPEQGAGYHEERGDQDE